MTTLETTTNDYKEQIKNIRAAWKQFHAEEKHKKYGVEDSYTGDIHKVSDLCCHHHLLYAALCKKDISKCFSPLSERKCESFGQKPYWVFYRTVDLLKTYYSTAKEGELGKIPEDSWRYKSYLRAKESLFLPFGDSITLEDIGKAIKRLEVVEL